MLARLDGDTDTGGLRETLRETIRRELRDAVEIVLWPAPLRIAEGHEYDAERGAYATAQKWLSQKHCDILVWGRAKGQNVLSLRFTVAGLNSQDPETYKLSETFDLPADFVSNLGAAIAARIVTAAAPAVNMAGHYLVPLMHQAAERLAPIIQHLSPTYAAETRGPLLTNYAQVLQIIGEQKGSNSDLVSAISAYQEALKEYTRERLPLAWAMTQNNLGTALSSLGGRESGTERLEQAVAAYARL